MATSALAPSKDFAKPDICLASPIVLGVTTGLFVQSTRRASAPDTLSSFVVADAGFGKKFKKSGPWPPPPASRAGYGQKYSRMPRRMYRSPSDQGQRDVPLQNRVTPFGEIIVHPARGLLMGNRGILHDGERRLGRARWRHPHWVTCLLVFRGRWREVMRPRHYTELFFLDEATAL